ncbi:Mechanosensitive ion channel family protein [Perilla frutescens var. hirtella]|uniref:Mechanosensitive ion channel family protein n=1 Tax=Perilla frutescens var. hirtella TaxID=608512 RepID=A0AAD4ITU7_PERFH|nr:Mechanosensitive ion channel family protein [Perilla frutescens var. hirtella]
MRFMLEDEVKVLKTLPLLENGNEEKGITKQVLKDWIHKGITIDRLHRWNRNNIFAWNMKRLMNIVRSSMLSTFDERIKEAGSVGKDEAKLKITSENQAAAAARKIFFNVVNPEFE